MLFLGVLNFRIFFCFRKNCFDYFYHIILILVRVFLIFLFLYQWGGNLLNLLFVDSWRMLYINWWDEEDDDEDKFLTNGSYFNAGMCWILWVYMIGLQLLIILALLWRCGKSCFKIRKKGIHYVNYQTRMSLSKYGHKLWNLTISIFLGGVNEDRWLNNLFAL